MYNLYIAMIKQYHHWHTIDRRPGLCYILLNITHLNTILRAIYIKKVLLD